MMLNPPTDVALGLGMSVVATVRVDPTPSLFERLRAWPCISPPLQAYYFAAYRNLKLSRDNGAIS
jgi:hypothetical protein